MTEQKPGDADKGGKGTGGSSYLGLIAVILGIALLYWFTTVFVDWNKTQTCVSYGMRNCTPRVPLDHD